ncbi:MAG TPA: hypothetical protein VEK08_15405 [Planctomycetota bacterium]|nr:hypothetical protein [Planctomycetota bacterium]
MQNNSQQLAPIAQNAGNQNSGTMLAYTPRVRNYSHRQRDLLFERLESVPKLRKTAVGNWRKN